MEGGDPQAPKSDYSSSVVTRREAQCPLESEANGNLFFFFWLSLSLTLSFTKQLGAFRLFSDLAGNYTWHPGSSGMYNYWRG